MNTQERPRGAVRRSLFGPVDQEQLRRDLSHRLKEITEQDSRRWNFDFEKNTPLPGRFQWEEIPADCAATFYRKESREPPMDQPVSSHSEATEDRQCPCEDSPVNNQENCPSVFNILKSPAELTPVRRKRTRSKCDTKPSQNARITDFFSKRRRSTETKSVRTPLFTAPTEASLCRTIR